MNEQVYEEATKNAFLYGIGIILTTIEQGAATFRVISPKEYFEASDAIKWAAKNIKEIK